MIRPRLPRFLLTTHIAWSTTQHAMCHGRADGSVLKRRIRACFMDLSIVVGTIFRRYFLVFLEFYGGCIRVTGAKVVLGAGTCFSYF